MADRSVVARLGANVTGYVNGVRVAKAATIDFSKNAIAYGQKHQAQLDELANKAAILGTGMLALAGFAVKAAMDWETAWAGVTKTIDGTPAQLAAIEQGLQDMSAVKPTSAIELAAIAESAGALGVKTEDILSFTSVMADLGQTTNLTSEEAATSIAQLMNIMQTAPEDVDNLGAALVDLGNKGASTERQIIQMAQNIAGAGAIVGLSEANVLALGNALASSGIEAEAGGSAISNVLIDIDKAVATGSDKLAKFAEVAGMSADGFAASWKADPADAIATFVEGLGAMNARGEDVFSTLDGLGQSDIRVTRALLNMAASGDMLRESLANGDAAWQQNTALAEEAAKRYDTTASQAKMAWNEIKSSAVSAGDALLPVVAGIAGVVGDLAGAFGDLPAPAQTALTSIVGIGGVALVATAGIMKMVTTIGAAKLALDGLALSGGRAAVAMGVIGKGGAGLAAFWGGAALGDQVGERGTKQIDELADSLEKLGKTGKATGDLEKMFGSDLGGKVVRFGKDLGGIGEALKSLDGYADDNSFTETLKFFGSGGQSAGITAQAEALMDLDKAFTTLAKDKPDDAIAAFEKLRDRALETGASTKDIERAFPEMTSMLQEASKSMGGTSDASEILNGNLTDLAPAAQVSAEAMAAAQEALDKARESAMATGLSFLSFSRDAKQSFADYLAELEKGATAYAEFTENAIQASSRGLDAGFIEQLRQQGPEGALLLADFADASEKEIDRANRAFRNTTGLADLQAELSLLPDDIVTQFDTAGAPGAIQTAAAVANEYDMTPDLVETILKAKDYTKADIKAVLARLAELQAVNPTVTIDAETDQARTAISSLKSALDSINPFKTITIKTVRTGADAGSSKGGTGPTKQATGGSVIGPGTGTSDDILTLLSNGEHVLTAAEVQQMGGQAAVYRFREQLRAGNVMAYNTGGAVTKLDVKNQERTVRDLERSLRETEKVGKGKNKRTRLVLPRGSLDRQIAELELADARRELADLRSGATARREAAETAAEKAKEARENRLDTAIGTRDSVANGLSGGFGLGQFTGKNEYGFYNQLKGSTIAAGAAAFAAKIKAFTGKFEAARKLGIPVAMLQEAASLGVEEGTQALDALLSSSAGDIASLQASYRDIETYAQGAGEVLAKALDLATAGQDSATGYAEGFINGLNGYATAIGDALNNATQGKKTTVPAKGGKGGSLTAYGIGVPAAPSTGLNTGGSWGASAQTFTAEAFGAGYAASAVQPVSIDYDQLAAAMAVRPTTLNANLLVSGRQAGTLVQAGQTALERQG